MSEIQQRYAEIDASHDYIWVRDPNWTMARDLVVGKKCRQLGCDRPAVAALNRSRDAKRPRWWCYCDDREHLYGRRIIDGAVMVWRRVSA